MSSRHCHRPRPLLDHATVRAVFSQSAGTPATQRDFMDAIRSLSRRNPEAAIKKIDQLGDFRTFPEVKTFKGKLLMRLGRNDEARDVLRDCVAMYPADVPARMTLAKLYKMDGLYQCARAQYEIILCDNMDDLKAACALAELECREENYDLARDLVRLVLQQSPDDVAAWTTMGKIEMQTDNSEAARRIFQSILQIAPDDVFIQGCLTQLEPDRRRGALRAPQFGLSRP